MTNEQLTAKLVDSCVGILGEERTDNRPTWVESRTCRRDNVDCTTKPIVNPFLPIF